MEFQLLLELSPVGIKLIMAIRIRVGVSNCGLC